jgi:hypothetical protein
MMMDAALALGLGHFTLPCLAALGTTSKHWHARVQAAIHAAAPAAAQHLVLQIADHENTRVPTEAVLKPLLESAYSNTADGDAVACFATALATNLLFQTGITTTQARVQPFMQQLAAPSHNQRRGCSTALTCIKDLMV